MKLIPKWLRGEKRGRVQTALVKDPVLASWFGGNATAAGQSVTHQTALALSAAYRCVWIISQSAATLPVILYKTVDGGKQRADKHPLYSVLKTRPNRYQTPRAFKQMLFASAVHWGNGYAAVLRKDGEITDLVPIMPDRVCVKLSPENERVYEITRDRGGKIILLQDEMLHITGFTLNGYTGVSPLTYARESIGFGLGAQEFGARVFGNGARPSGVLEIPEQMSPEAYDRLKKSWDEQFQGAGNAHRVAIIEEGAKFSKVSMTPEDVEFIGNRKFNWIEMCQFYGVPPHKVYDLERSHFRNIEHQSIEFVTDSLGPYLTEFEQACTQYLLTPKERGQYFAEFMVDALLRGDIKSRYEAYRIGVTTGWLSRNEVRKRENMDPFPGGDEYLQPLNMTEAGDTDEKPEIDGDQDDEEGNN